MDKSVTMPRRLLRTDLLDNLTNYMANVSGQGGLGNEPLIGNQTTLDIDTVGVPYGCSTSNTNMVSHFPQTVNKKHTCSTKRAVHATSPYNSSPVLQPQSKKQRPSEICED